MRKHSVQGAKEALWIRALDKLWIRSSLDKDKKFFVFFSFPSFKNEGQIYQLITIFSLFITKDMSIRISEVRYLSSASSTNVKLAIESQHTRNCGLDHELQIRFGVGAVRFPRTALCGLGSPEKQSEETFPLTYT